jgi:hypothetical protein
LAFVFLVPVVPATQFRSGHYTTTTPTCITQPCQLADPQNSSSGYIDWNSVPLYTVYESIGFKYLCVGVQITVPQGGGNLVCGFTSIPKTAQVTASPESCSITGTSPSSDFVSNEGPTCFLRLTNAGDAGTSVSACFMGGQPGKLLTSGAAIPSAQIQIAAGGVAYVECQTPAEAPSSPGVTVAGQVTLANGASVVYSSDWSA